LSKYVLYNTNFCPFSRKVRFFLEEKGIDYQTKEVKYWSRSEDFLKLNPAHEVPVLKNLQTKEVICDSFLICNYINENEVNTDNHDYFNFFGESSHDMYEIQRLHLWFDKKFYNEVSKYFIEEIFLNFMKGNEYTNLEKINVGNINLEMHIKYMEFLLSRRKWLASEIFSVADIAAATQLSTIDYIGYIKWNKYLKLKEWYMTIKSKKGFRNILSEKIPGFKPSKYYFELDF
jgi:glutathione S-transferase